MGKPYRSVCHSSLGYGKGRPRVKDVRHSFASQTCTLDLPLRLRGRMQVGGEVALLSPTPTFPLAGGKGFKIQKIAKLGGAPSREKALDTPILKHILNELSICNSFGQEHELTVRASMAEWSFWRCTVGIKLPRTLYLFIGRLLTSI